MRQPTAPSCATPAGIRAHHCRAGACRIGV